MVHGRENLDEVQLSLRFWEIVLTSIEEVSFIREELVQRGFIRQEKLVWAARRWAALRRLVAFQSMIGSIRRLL